MHIDITPENLLIQLGYPTTPVMLEQMKDIIDNTRGFSKFSKHILSLNDELRHLAGYIAMSNSFKYLKIKTDNSSTDDVSAFVKTLNKWSDKYKVSLEKVDGKNTFYVIGQA
ncbi:MAG: hypothetical protein HF962_02750 [Sulfurovum sp.]|nr:hypothetical protein [Sulfurovum sp.]